MTGSTRFLRRSATLVIGEDVVSRLHDRVAPESTLGVVPLRRRVGRGAGREGAGRRVIVERGPSPPASSSSVNLGRLDCFPDGVWYWMEWRASPAHGSNASPALPTPPIRRTNRGPPRRLARNGSDPGGPCQILETDPATPP